MKIHELKCWPKYFYSVSEGRKRFEVRENDRVFEAGDTLHLRLFNPRTEEYDDKEGRICDAFVSVVRVWRDLPGLKEGYVIMDIRRLVPE